MHDHIFFNGKPAKAADARIPAICTAALYGKGVFSTVAIYNGDLFLWDEHWRRLRSNADVLKIDLSNFAEEKIIEQLHKLVIKNKFNNGRARVTFLDESSGGIWKYKDGQRTNLLIATADFRQVPEYFRLTVSPFRINSKSPLAGLKSCNYLEKIFALDEAIACGFDEAIMLNEKGEVTSACMANIFWLKNKILFTPPIETGCLPGTTREFVTQNAKWEYADSLESLHESDAIFLTSSGLGIVQVAEFDGRKIKRVSHPVTDILPKRI